MFNHYYEDLVDDVAFNQQCKEEELFIEEAEMKWAVTDFATQVKKHGMLEMGRLLLEEMKKNALHEAGKLPAEEYKPNFKGKFRRGWYETPFEAGKSETRKSNIRLVLIIGILIFVLHN